MDKIIFADGAGGISIVSPAPQYHENLEELAAQIVPSGVPFRVLNDAAFPQDRNYRSAWVFDFADPAAVITIDLAKAAEADRQKLPTITAAQLRLALLGMGITAATVEAAIGAMPGTDTQREAARIQWEYATTFPRQHPLVVGIGAALDLTEAQIDAAWLHAATL